MRTDLGWEDRYAGLFREAPLVVLWPVIEYLAADSASRARRA